MQLTDETADYLLASHMRQTAEGIGPMRKRSRFVRKLVALNVGIALVLTTFALLLIATAVAHG